MGALEQFVPHDFPEPGLAISYSDDASEQAHAHLAELVGGVVQVSIGRHGHHDVLVLGILAHELLVARPGGDEVSIPLNQLTRVHVY